jgi:hypothetical protein
VREQLKASAESEIRAANERLARGEIDEDAWYEKVTTVAADAYVAIDDAFWQSGWDGDARGWRQARELVVEPIDRSGDFLDVRCANGLLMESVARWAQERGYAIEPYGLEINAALAAVARKRLPHWSERIALGNVMDWVPPRQFSFVRTSLEYVPAAKRPDLVRRLRNAFVGANGRLIIGPVRVEDETPQQSIDLAGFEVDGQAESRDDRGVVRKVVWLEKPS